MLWPTLITLQLTNAHHNHSRLTASHKPLHSRARVRAGVDAEGASAADPRPRALPRPPHPPSSQLPAPWCAIFVPHSPSPAQLGAQGRASRRGTTWARRGARTQARAPQRPSTTRTARNRSSSRGFRSRPHTFHTACTPSFHLHSHTSGHLFGQACDARNCCHIPYTHCSLCRPCTPRG